MDEAEEVLGVIFPADEDAALAVGSKQRSARPASVACGAASAASTILRGADLLRLSDAARSSRCQLERISSSSGSLS